MYGGRRTLQSMSRSNRKWKSYIKEWTWVKSLYRAHSLEKEALNSTPWWRRDLSRVYSFTTKLMCLNITSTIMIPSGQERCTHLYSDDEEEVEDALWLAGLRLDDMRSFMA